MGACTVETPSLPYPPRGPQLPQPHRSICTSRSARNGWRPSATGSTPLWPHCSSWTSGEDPLGQDSSTSPTEAPRSPGPPSPRGSRLRRARSSSFPELHTQGGRPRLPALLSCSEPASSLHSCASARPGSLCGLSQFQP